MPKVKVNTPKCIVCNNRSVIEVEQKGWDRYNGGMYIQDAFPELSADDRELLLTGIHQECWDTFAPAEEEWEEDEG